MIYTEYFTIKEFAFLVPIKLEVMKSYFEESISTYQLIQMIDAEYLRINTNDLIECIKYKKGSLFVEDMHNADHIYFITSIVTKASDYIVLDFSLNTRGPQKYELDSVLTKTDFEDELFTNLGVDTSNMLYNFAYWPSFRESLKKLKNDIALKENWSYVESPTDDDFPILISYMKYTFSKLWKDKQLAYSYDNSLVTFNTGLVNKNYQYIYAVFEKNSETRPMWRFKDFCIPAIKAGGRLLAENFDKLPNPAHYFNSLSDVSYVISPDKTPDEQLPEFQFDHYFIDHPERLPVYFLEDGCRKSKEILDLLKKDISKYTQEDKKSHWEKIGELIGDSPEVYDDLEAAFRNAVRKTVMRVSWNYRTAIPVYFPTYNKMSILLPLSFGTDAKAEVALVVEKMPRIDRYIAPTILDLPKAYSNARLVCKPESDWLNQQVFYDIVSDEANSDDII